MRLQKLKNTITAAEDTEIDAAKNEEVFAELIQSSDNKSLAPLKIGRASCRERV